MKKSKQKLPKIRKTITNNKLGSIIIYITRSKNRFSSHKRQNIAFFNSIKRLCQISNFFIHGIPLLREIKYITIIVSMIYKKINTFLLKRFKSSVICVYCDFVNNNKRVREVENTELTKVKSITPLASKISINTLILRLKKVNSFQFTLSKISGKRLLIQ